MAERRTTSVRGRQLARELKRLREIDGRTGEDVAESLGWSSAKVSRIENAVTTVKLADLRRLLTLYEVGAEQRDILVELSRRADERGWWDAFPELGNDYATYIELENEAETVHCYSALVLHGLLQTADYARAVIQASGLLPPNTVQRRVQARMRRQRRLNQDPVVELHAVLDEASLVRPVGGNDVMRAQLGHLLELMDRGNVQLQLMPFSEGAHSCMSGSFIRLGLPYPANPVVHLEHQTGGFYAEDDIDVYKYGRIFDGLRARALTPEETRAYLARAVAA